MLNIYSERGANVLCNGNSLNLLPLKSSHEGKWRSSFTNEIISIPRLFEFDVIENIIEIFSERVLFR